MKTEWQTEVPARLQEFREILRNARTYYIDNPSSPAETRIYICERGHVGGRRMIGRFETHAADGLTWPIVDISAKFPQGRGFMNANVDIAFANAVRMRAEYWNYRCEQRLTRGAA